MHISSILIMSSMVYRKKKFSLGIYSWYWKMQKANQRPSVPFPLLSKWIPLPSSCCCCTRFLSHHFWLHQLLPMLSLTLISISMAFAKYRNLASFPLCLLSMVFLTQLQELSSLNTVFLCWRKFLKKPFIAGPASDFSPPLLAWHSPVAAFLLSVAVQVSSYNCCSQKSTFFPFLPNRVHALF